MPAGAQVMECSSSGSCLGPSILLFKGSLNLKLLFVLQILPIWLIAIHTDEQDMK